MGCGEFVMNQSIFVGNGGGKFCGIWSIPGTLYVIVLVWSVVLQRDGRYRAVLIPECGGECVAVWITLDGNVTVDKVVVRGLYAWDGMVVDATLIGG